jgi:hypothetical protein
MVAPETVTTVPPRIATASPSKVSTVEAHARKTADKPVSKPDFLIAKFASCRDSFAGYVEGAAEKDFASAKVTLQLNRER